VNFDDVREFLGKHGIHTGSGKLLVRRHIPQIFSNPFYYGHFRYAGEVYEGKHEPIVSKKLFDDVQTVIDGRWRWTPKEVKRKPKAFTQLLHCGECGGAITAEIQKGHIYYRCSKKNRASAWCQQPYIREEGLDAEITALLKPFALRADWADDMLLRIDKEKKQAAQTAMQLAEQKRAEIDKINARLHKGFWIRSWTR
jgi:hypothetical protein